MLNKLLSAFGLERKESRTWGALVTLGTLDMPVWPAVDYESRIRAGYQFNTDVFACVSLIAGCAKQVPWLVFEKEGGVDARPNTPAGALLKLLRKPNEIDSEAEFKESAIAYELLSGNTYIERSGGKEETPPAFLYPLRPDRVRVKTGNRRNLVSGYRYTVNGKPTDFEPWEILHLRLFNPLDDYYGMSPMEAGIYTVDSANEATKLYKKLLQRGYPPGAVAVKGEGWSQPQIDQFKAGLRRAAEANQVLYLGNAEWVKMGFTPVDASLFEGRKFSKRDIAAIFKVPSEMIGDTESKTYANYGEARRSLYTEAVIPALIELRDGLNNWLSPLYGNAYIDIDRDAIDALAEDREVQAKRISRLWRLDLIMRNEGRLELKYPAVPKEQDGFYSELVEQAVTANAEDGLSDREDEREDEDEAVEETGEPLPKSFGRRGRHRGNEPGSRSYHLRHGYSRADQREDSRRHHRRSDSLLKAFNLVSEEQKDNYWKDYESQRELWYQRIAADVEERFSAEKNAVLAAFREGEVAAIRAVTRQEDAWTKLYRSTYLNVSEDFARRVLAGLKSDGYSSHETKLEQDVFTATVQQWLATEGAKRVVGVLDTTKEAIRRELKIGHDAGETIFDLSKRLQGMYREFGNVRSERIARTEVISASNLGSQTAARSTNLPLEKEWLATPDNRTRDPHAAANGQRRAISEPYIVAGQKLMYPGDSIMGASADNVIQCRCSETYRVKRG